jgi:hypothetical protein
MRAISETGCHGVTAFPFSLTFSALAMVFLLSYKHFLDFGVGREEELLLKNATCMPAINNHRLLPLLLPFLLEKLESKICFAGVLLRISFLETGANTSIQLLEMTLGR